MPNISSLKGKRNHGAQPGNKNAFKHGFYTQHFTPEEINLLDRLDDDLIHEIKVLRAYVHRLSTMLEGKDDYSENDLAKLTLLNSICVTIGGLTSTRAFQTGKVTDVQEAITEGIIYMAPINFPHLVGSKR
jgi:hypothetical protein